MKNLLMCPDALQEATDAAMEVVLSSNSCCATEELRSMGTGSLVPVSPGVTVRAAICPSNVPPQAAANFSCF